MVRLLPILLALASGSVSAQLHYSAQLSDDAKDMHVSVCSARAQPAGALYSGGRAAARFVTELEGDGSSRPQLQGRAIQFQGLAAGECLRYRVNAHAAAMTDRYQLGWRPGDYLMLPLDLWLWRPAHIADGSQLRLALPKGWSASLPFPPLNASGTFRLSQSPIDWDGTSAFGRVQEQPIDLPGGRLRVSVLPPVEPRQRQTLIDWVAENANALLMVNGRLPLQDVQVLIVPLPGVSEPVPWGEVTRAGGSALKLFVGLDASSNALHTDWTLAHELSHLLHPYLYSRGRWLSEGLASYYQNVLRARSGVLSPEKAWRNLDAGFARGREEGGSRGQPLSHAAERGHRSTMRVYWSGAAYWLEAELALRQRGLALGDVLDAFATAHLPASERWEPERFVAELDRQAGVELFVPLYAKYATGTEFPSLDAIYQPLGLGEGIGRLALGTPSADDADAGKVRDAIMRRSVH